MAGQILIQRGAGGGGGGGGSPGGSNTQVQYNDGGAFGGDAGLTFDETTDTLTIGGCNLVPLAADSLAMRNGTTAQEIYIYGAYTDDSNYNRLRITAMKRNASRIEFISEKAGTGGDLGLWFISTASVNFDAGPNEVKFLVAGNDALILDLTSGFGALRPGNDGFRLLGTASNRWSQFYLKEFWEGDEISAPAAPSANKGRLFWRDNGSGKTQLAAIFPTGAVQVIATEP